MTRKYGPPLGVRTSFRIWGGGLAVWPRVENNLSALYPFFETRHPLGAPATFISLSGERQVGRRKPDVMFRAMLARWPSRADIPKMPKIVETPVAKNGYARRISVQQTRDCDPISVLKEVSTECSHGLILAIPRLYLTIPIRGPSQLHWHT
jgi:hypothetical protein